MISTARGAALRGFALGVAVMAGATTACAQDWVEPARGSQLRRDLLDALRPIAEWNLGAPVEFYVSTLRVRGDHAFGMVLAQRPGGGAIDMAQTPIVKRGEFDPEQAEVGAGMEAFWIKSGAMWSVVDYGIGSTDVWFQSEPFCTEFGPLIPEYCRGLR